MATILADLMLRLRSNSADLQKGLDTSKKSVKSYDKTVKKSSKSTSKAFSNLSKGATGSLGMISKSLGSISGESSGAASGFASLASGAATLNIALGPIGLILAAVGVAVAALKSYFTNTTEGAEVFAKMMGYLSGVMGYFQDVLADVGKWLVKAFEDPQTAVADLWDMIKNNLINRFKGFIDMYINGFKALKNGFLGLGYAIKGVFSDDAKKKSEEYFAKMKDSMADFGKSFAQTLTGLNPDDVLDKVTTGLAEINRRAKIGEDIGKRRADLELDRIKLIRLEADAVTNIANLLLDSKNKDKKTLAEREAALKRAIKIQSELSAAKVKIAKEAYEIEKKANKELGKSGPEALRKEEELYAKMMAAKKESADKTRELVNRQNELGNIIRTVGEEYKNLTEIEAKAAKATAVSDAKRLAAKEKEEKQAAAKLLAAKNRAELKAMTSLQSYKESKLKATQEGELALLKDKYDKGLILEEEYQGRKQDIIDKWAAVQKQTMQNHWADQFEATIYWGDQIQSYFGGLMSALSSMWEVSKQNELKAAGDNAKKKEEIERKYARKQKSVAVAQAMINGALGVTKAFAQLGPIAGAIAAGLVMATTAVQVASINSQQFAKGGIVSGPTNALIGEYPNAKSNPEVIAPLSDLRSILGNVLTKDIFSGMSGSSFINNKSSRGNATVEFIITGDDLKATLDRQDLKNSIY